MTNEEGYSIDEALSVINGTNEQNDVIEEQQEPENQEQSTNQQSETTEQSEQTPEGEANQPEQHGEVEQETLADKQPANSESQTPDFNQVIKFKENGQEVELTLSQLIDRAQKGSNYERRMQELAEKQRNIEVTQQQPSQQPLQQEDKLQTLQQQLNEFTAKFQQEYGVDFNQFDPMHQMAFAQYQVQEQAKQVVQIQQQEMQQMEWQTQEQRYSQIIETNLKEPEAEKINDFALQSLFSLPQQGKEGVYEFNRLYPIYQKIIARDQYLAGDRTIEIEPFTANEINQIEKFFTKAKADYAASKQKEQVKEQVPKSAPIKPTVKVESTTGGDPTPTKKVDFKKMQSMDIDEIAKLL